MLPQPDNFIISGMKSFIAPIIFLFSYLFAQDTFSIVAIDTTTGEIGSAGASCINALSIPGGCVVISHILPGRGAIHTQAQYLASNKAYGASLLASGKLPQEILDSLISYDAANNATVRQYGVVVWDNLQPYSGGFTGINCMDYKNHIVGRNYAIQGNILLNQGILDSMEARFLRTEGDLACKLMEALEGAKVPGADTRCLSRGTSSLSAFLRVARPTDTLGAYAYDLNVPYGPNGFEPIDSLRTLFLQQGGCVITQKKPDELSEIRVYFAQESGELILSGYYPEQASLILYASTGQEIWRGICAFPGKLKMPETGAGTWIYRIQWPSGREIQGKYITVD
jgi:uncharacterized Ntn-hydrolase superfamily protein